VTVKRVIADAGVSVDAKWRADEIWIQDSGIRTSLVVRRRRNEGECFDVTVPQVRAAESKPMQQTLVWVACVTTAAAKCDMRSFVIIIELSYRIVIAIILIYRIVYRSKTVFDIS